jgi:hypothetical protein
MFILGISGRKQSGKSTTGNFIVSIYLSDLAISENVYLNEYGQIIVSDLLGDKNYAGVFDPTNIYSDDYTIKQVIQRLRGLIKIYNFADVLKQDVCMGLLGLTYEQCYGTDDEKNRPTDMMFDGKNMSSREILQFIGTDIFRTLKPNIWVDATIKKIQKERPKLAIITDCRFPNEVQSIKDNGGKVLRLTRDPHHSDHISESVLDMDRYNWNNFDHIIDNKNMPMLEQLSETQKILSLILESKI